MTFEQFYKTLISEQVWFEAVQMTYRNKDYKQVAMECYTWLLSQPNVWRAQDYARFRGSYQKFLLYAPEKIDTVVRNVAEPVVIHPQALTGEARLKKIAEFKEVLAKIPALKPTPRSSRDLIENGDWRPKPETIHEPSEVEKRTAYINHLEEIRLSRGQTFRAAYPDASEEEVIAYIDTFNSIDNPLGI